MNGWFAVVAPAGVPPKWCAAQRAIGEYLKGPEIQKRLLDFGLATEGRGRPRAPAIYLRDAVALGARPRVDIQPQ